MNTIYIMRHSLTEANEKRLYGGSTDIPLTERGREIARSRQGVVPVCAVYVTSGMKRADETLFYMSEKKPDLILDGLREMDFGAFEMRSYDELKDLPEYIRWIGDASGETRCPGGECRREFNARVLSAGRQLLAMNEPTACVVCHGGAIVTLMEHWFPSIQRHFYEWQPGPCAGYKISVSNRNVTAFKEV